MKNSKFILKLAAILFAISFICTLLLVLCNALTKDRIAQLKADAENSARIEVLPDASNFETTKAEGVQEAYIGKNSSDEVVGYCFKVQPSGFGGSITMIVGINTDGSVSGVKITDMAETPGLGAKASENDWISQFSGKGGEISVVKGGKAKDNEVNAISGATITSKAVANGVNTALQAAETLNEKEGK